MYTRYTTHDRGSRGSGYSMGTMPSRFVKQPDGRLASFSTVVDDFTAVSMSPDEAFCFALEREVEDCENAVRRGLFDSEQGHGRPEKPAEGDGCNRWREALSTIYAVHRNGEARVARAEAAATEQYPVAPLTEAELAAVLAAERKLLGMRDKIRAAAKEES